MNKRLSELLRSRLGLATKWDLERMESRLFTLIHMKASEELQALTDLGTQLDKANTEIQQKITDLQTAVDNADVPPEVEAAVNALKVSAQKLDDIVPDAPPVPPAV